MDNSYELVSITLQNALQECLVGGVPCNITNKVNPLSKVKS